VDSHPEVFSPHPVAESQSHQGLDTDTPAAVQSNSNWSPPIFIKNQNPFNFIKLRNVLSPIVGSEGSVSNPLDFVIINTADCVIHYKTVELLAKTNLSFYTFAPRGNLPT
jgi:hypothetical protein